MSKQISQGKKKGAVLVKRLEKLTNKKGNQAKGKLRQVKGDLKKDLAKAKKKI
jgi:hypothetical protein